MSGRRSTTIARLVAVCLVAVGFGTSACTTSESTVRTTGPAATVAPPAAGWSPPWRSIDDPRQLPRPWPGARAILRSSWCPSGCAYDRHSPDDPRWLRVDDRSGDAEGVLFDEVGPGAITRLWMTTGHGTSRPLPDDVGLRVYLDGARVPVIDLPLARLFDGSTPPFTPPLAFDRTRSSGGNVSHVPIPYRTSCRVVLAGPGLETLKLWYQIEAMRLPEAAGVLPFGAPGFEERDLAPLRRLLGAVAADGSRSRDVLELDAWAPAAARGVPVGRWSAGRGRLGGRRGDADEPLELFAASRPGMLTGLRLELPVEAWRHVRLRLEVDGRATVDARLSALLGLRRLPGPTRRDRAAPSLRTLLVRYDGAEDAIALDFPMPWHRSMRLLLVPEPRSADAPALLRRPKARWRVRHLDAPPSADAMAFSARVRTGVRGDLDSGPDDPPGTVEPLPPLPLVDVRGAGKWVGLGLDLLGARGPRAYLEGDEWVWIDDAAEPALVGTGVEDFFSAGFYFDTGPFSTPLHGLGAQEATRRYRASSALRLRLHDAVPFRSGLRAELEAGPLGETSMASLAVAYLYLRPVD